MLPICNICAKTGVLCSACETKLDEEKITEIDVEFARMLYERFEGKIGFKRAIDTEDFIVILTERENVGKIIGKSGAIIKKMGKDMGKEIRVVGIGDMKDMIYDFIAPARVKGINEVFKPDNITGYKVRIDARDKDKLRIDLGSMSKVISSLTEKDIELSFE